MSARYVVDENGKRVSVILPVEEYEWMVEELEELEDIRAAEEVRGVIKRGEEEFIPGRRSEKRSAPSMNSQKVELPDRSQPSGGEIPEKTCLTRTCISH